MSPADADKLRRALETASVVIRHADMNERMDDEDVIQAKEQVRQAREVLERVAP